MNAVAAILRVAKSHAGALVLLCAPVAGSCVFQPIQENAASGSTRVVLPIEPGNVQDPGDGTIPAVTITPPIYGYDLATGYDKTKTTNACEHTNAQATALLTNFCAPCHDQGAASKGAPQFKDVLNIDALVSTTTETDMKGVPFIVPGYPERSRLYQKVEAGSMPSVPGVQSVTRKLTVSEVSVLEQWIAVCLNGGKRPTPPASAPATTGGTTSTGATSATSTTMATGATTGGPTGSGAGGSGAGGAGGSGAGGATGAGGSAAGGPPAGTGGSAGMPVADAGAAGGGMGGGLGGGGRRGGGG